jgi:hypothetical protein
MWEDSVKGVVYMATDAIIAESHAEASDIAYDRFGDVDIVIFEVDTDYLDLDKLYLDQNILDNDGSSFEYHGIIPTEALTIIPKENSMRRNPRPIPLNYQMIFDLAETILDSVERDLLLFKGTVCDSIPFTDSWRKEYQECFTRGGVPQWGSTVEYPIDLQIQDVTGKNYHLKGVLVSFGPDVGQVITGGSWYDLNLDDAKEILREAQEVLATVEPISRQDKQKLQRAMNEYIETSRALKDGGALTIEFSLMDSPAKLRMYLKQHRKDVLYTIQEYLVHELTHLKDRSVQDLGEDYGDLGRGYWNNPFEVRAEMHRIIFLLWRDLIWDKSVDWSRDLKPRFVREPFDKVFADYIYDTRVDWNGYTPKNQAKIRSAVIQWLQENGFDLPRRHF